MSSPQTGTIAIRDLRGGRNRVDPPQSLGETECTEALNVDWFNATFARKRFGVSAVAWTGSPFTTIMSSMHRHVPGTNEAAAELWATDSAASPHIGRLAGGTVWASPTLTDGPTGNGWDFSYASLNGKLFIAYLSGVDRLHVWDPVTNAVRRTGLAAMVVPTVADTGGGAYAAVLRYYRTRATEQRAGITVRRSEPSASVSFTPSGAGTAARVTRGTAPGEVETHWEVEASLDNTTFYRIATVVIGTTTYDDSAGTTTYANNPVSALTGVYTLQKSYKFIAADQGRILGFGAYTPTNPQSRIEFSAVLGSSDIGDDERVPIGNYVGLDDNDSGFATALCGPVNGSFYAGKYRQLWKLTPTGSPAIPYTVLPLSKIIGVVGPKAITLTEDEDGRQNISWMSSTGPYRLGINGIEYIGKGVEDYTISAGPNSAYLSLDAATVVCHVQWYRDQRQAWFWVAITGGAEPTTVLVCSVGRPGRTYAWSVYTGGIGGARCAVMFSATVGASMGRQLIPYIGSATSNGVIGACDSSTQDFNVSYGGSIVTRVYRPWGDNFSGSITGGQLVALPSALNSITVSTRGNFGGVTDAAETVSLAAAGSETRVIPRIGGAVTQANLQMVAFRVGDLTDTNNSWQIDEVNMTWVRGGQVIG